MTGPGDTDAAILSTLAAGLCQDAGVALEVHPDRWSWDPVRRVIKVPAKDLDEHGPDYCAGILSREVGHYFLARHHLFATDFPSTMAADALLTALDAPRVERWMRARYPGVRPWLAMVSQPPDLIRPDLPAFVQFVLACATEHTWLGQPARTLDDRVIEALEVTRPARQLYARIAPPTTLEAPQTPALYERYREEVAPFLLNPAWLPSRWEQTVQLTALDALEVAEELIFPSAEQLLGDDLQRLERYLMGDPNKLAELRKMLEDGTLQLVIGGHDQLPYQQPPAWLQALAQELLDAAIRGDRPLALMTSSRVQQERAGWHRLPDFDDPLDMDWRPAGSYDLALSQINAQVHQLARHLGEILRPRKRLRERSGYPSGRRVDMRKVMQFEADPRRYNELWIRSSIPDRRSVAISLLVDLSGSMRGQKSRAALLGTILLAETLHSLEIPFAINGFQDVLIPLADFGEGLVPETRKNIAELVQEVIGTRRGGNNKPNYNDDGPCLLAAADQLIAHPASHRILIVVSDGLPEGRHSDVNDLKKAVLVLKDPDVPVELIGLGLGPNTGHVTQFYPEARANISVDRFSTEIGNLIEKIVLE
ncbi:MAG: hypothetical protein R3F60_25550 [bacterium]